MNKIKKQPFKLNLFKIVAVHRSFVKFIELKSSCILKFHKIR